MGEKAKLRFGRQSNGVQMFCLRCGSLTVWALSVKACFCYSSFVYGQTPTVFLSVCVCVSVLHVCVDERVCVWKKITASM